jgi:hypothetical protein
MRKTNVVSALSKVYSVVDPMDCGVGAPHMQTQNLKEERVKTYSIYVDQTNIKAVQKP